MAPEVGGEKTELESAGNWCPDRPRFPARLPFQFLFRFLIQCLRRSPDLRLQSRKRPFPFPRSLQCSEQAAQMRLGAALAQAGSGRASAERSALE